MDEVAIRCRGIKKFYGKGENRVEALRGIDLDIHKGELTLLVGPSGSGKTTLLSVITTILTPDEGQLFLFGQEIHVMSENEKSAFCRDNLGVVFQSLFLIPTLTAAENVSLPLLIAGVREDQAIKKAIEMLDKVHMGHRPHVSPSELSKGQQQRVAIARAMVTDAEIIVCDEPTSALDEEVGHEVMRILHGLANEASKAVLVVTHDQRTFPYADRIIKMNDGQLIKE